MPQFVSTEEDEFLNWEVLLKTDEAIFRALNILNHYNDFFEFDGDFLRSLIAWYANPKYQKHFYSKKQYDAAFNALNKRYLKKLENYANTNKEFKTFLNSLDVQDEEFVEIVTEIKNPMECPICDPSHNVVLSEVSDFVAGATGSATVKCDRCHQTITFLVEGT